MLVRALGAEHSPIRPALYLIIFCVLDLLAIIIQAVGGAMAALALQNDKSSSTGSWIMVGGILIQLVGMVSFCILGLIFGRNVRKSASWREKEVVRNGRVGLLAWGLIWISFWILVR
jgi:predicted lysophospholipase L1 biosynthesis ABC-type transport system permease subunit